jgi:hypothetical protein
MPRGAGVEEDLREGVVQVTDGGDHTCAAAGLDAAAYVAVVEGGCPGVPGVLAQGKPGGLPVVAEGRFGAG